MEIEVAKKMIVGTLTVVPVKGEIVSRPVEVKDVGEATHAILEDYLELVPYFEKYNEKRCAVFVGENGKLKGLPVNERATALWREAFPGYYADYLVGPAVIVTGDASFMRRL